MLNRAYLNNSLLNYLYHCRLFSIRPSRQVKFHTSGEKQTTQPILRREMGANMVFANVVLVEHSCWQNKLIIGTEAIGNSDCIDVIYLDFRTDFDSVPHK